jgi:single-stranded-DNA-specific exonuclease
MLSDFDAGDDYTLCVHRPEWHAGVVGLLASRLKDRFHRPVFAFAADGAWLRGSGRSIASLHLRDALDLVDKRHPGLLERFGGHAAAAGLTIGAGGLEAFRAAFESVAREWLTAADLERRIDTDGALEPGEQTIEFARLLRDHVWGQGFPEPRFEGRFSVRNQKVVGEKHLKLQLASGERKLAAMRFGSAEPLPDEFTAVYRLDVNEYLGNETLQLTLEYVIGV